MAWGSKGCRVIGCDANLSEQKFINRKYRLCQAHKACGALLVNDTPCRFCSQCSSLRPVDNFDGKRRSCKTCSSTTKKINADYLPTSGKIGKECRALGISPVFNNPETACSSKTTLMGLELAEYMKIEDFLAKRRRIIANQELSRVTFELIGIKYDILRIDLDAHDHAITASPRSLSLDCREGQKIAKMSSS